MYLTKVRFALCLMLIWWTAAIPASAQHFKQIPGSLDYISAGRAEVWGILCTEVYCVDSEVYRFNSSTHTFVKLSGTPQGLINIAVGGGSALQSDEVWGIDGASNVYRFNFTKNDFVKVPGKFFQIAVGEGDVDKCHPYEVWGVFGPNVAEPGTFRYNYCTAKFDQIQTPNPFAQIAVGQDNVWAIDENSCLWQWAGPTWNEAEPYPCGYVGGHGYSGIAAGMSIMWAFDGLGFIYVWNINGTTGDFVDLSFFSTNVGIPTQIAAGGDGVWLITNDGGSAPAPSLFRLEPSFSYVSLPSHPARITVGSGAGVWVIDSSRHVYAWVRP